MNDVPADPPAAAPAAADRVAIYDTTLRDGTQREGISLACADKLRIAQQLDALGVDFIEGGWPGSNPKDAEFFRRARDLAWPRAAIAAFGSTRHAGVPADDDLGLAALIDSRAPVCTLFGKSSIVHVTDVLRTTADENLRMIEDSVAWLVARGRRVVYDAEHFFDGAREDDGYAYETLRAAVRGGAEVIVLCDTNGGTLPWDVEARVRDVVRMVGRPVGIHAHDDAGCGVANSLAAVRAGATHVQGTINGYGERCGNANLTSIIPGLALKLGRPCLQPGALPVVGRVARFVAETANLAFDEHAPYVGRSAFAHKGGVHVAAIRRSPRSYEHVDPELVGNRTRVVVSELSGRGNVLAKAEQFDVALVPGVAGAVLARLKQREQGGCAFESAEASVALMLRREDAAYRAPFQLVDYKVLLGQRARRRAVRRGRDQAPDPRRAAPHRRRRQRAGQRDRRRAAQGAGRRLPRDRGDPARRLQGPHPRRPRRHLRGHPRADRSQQRAQHRRRAVDHGRRLAQHRRGVAHGAGRWHRARPVARRGARDAPGRERRQWPEWPDCNERRPR